MEKFFIGVMSGTSLDGLDAVLLSTQDKKLSTLAHHSISFPNSLRENLLALCSSGENEIERCGELDVVFGEFTAQAVNELLKKTGLLPKEITAIGSHGQTIRHRPYAEHPFTWQIGNPSIIAHRTGITTVADFRMADIAAGGQGAPLVPAFHHAAFASHHRPRVVINIGGISNITFLPSTFTDPIIGYDIGPGNTLMDQWAQKILKKPFDNNGRWARTGKVNPTLLSQFHNDPFAQKTGPKSSGREYFNLQWLEANLTKAAGENSQTPIFVNEDIQRTLTEFTASLIAESVKRETKEDPCEIFLCGGGVNNNLLMASLESRLPNYSIETTAKLGIDPQHVEAAAFAWLASQTLAGLTGNITEVTGACCPKILGGIYPV